MLPPQAPLLPGLIETYLDRCTIEGKSPRTIRGYRESLTRFSRCLQEDGAPLEPDQIRPDHIIAYFVRFAALSPDTRHRYFREVRCFWNRLRVAGYTDNDAFRGFRNVRLPVRIVQPLTPEEVARLFACCDTATEIGRRDCAILLTLLDTGIRCSEMVQLDLADCALSERRLRIRQGTGGKDRVVPFAGRCAEALAAYFADRGTAPGPIFVSAYRGQLRDGFRLRAEGLRARLHKIGDAAGVPRVHPHRFRHTFATWAIAHDAREIDVQHLLGHSCPDMVRRYSATYGSVQAAERHAAFSPVDGMVADPS
ncbi:MAG: tyrosine-type recombinase/integrase [Chloroflexi bacterium]|nr:tyrosine-type recombinase/integrase [Chloroflexota bacterium]